MSALSFVPNLIGPALRSTVEYGSVYRSSSVAGGNPQKWVTVDGAKYYVTPANYADLARKRIAEYERRNQTKADNATSVAIVTALKSAAELPDGATVTIAGVTYSVSKSNYAELAEKRIAEIEARVKKLDDATKQAIRGSFKRASETGVFSISESEDLAVYNSALSAANQKVDKAVSDADIPPDTFTGNIKAAFGLSNSNKVASGGFVDKTFKTLDFIGYGIIIFAVWKLAKKGN